MSTAFTITLSQDDAHILMCAAYEIIDARNDMVLMGWQPPKFSYWKDRDLIHLRNVAFKIEKEAEARKDT